GHVLFQLLQRAKHKNENNEWDSIFDVTTTRPSIGLRMPYADKRAVTPDREWLDNHRRVACVNVCPPQEELPRCITLAKAEGRTHGEWAKNGMCRRTGKELSYCAMRIPRAPEGQRNRRR
ncbi:unnamed protein product, partial [Symbiodinium sp. CCMP2456]